MKVLIVVVLAMVAIVTALPFEREITPNAHAIPDYALKRIQASQEAKKGETDTSDLKTDSSLWWSPGYRYPYIYTKVYNSGYYPDMYYTPYYTLYQ